MITQRQFVERHGEPTSYIFKGQYFDSGHTSKMKCTVCGADIRFCYVLKQYSSDRSTPTSRKLTIGRECFRYFKKTENQVPLEAAVVLLETEVRAEVLDTKVYGPLREVRERRDAWRKLKRQALDVIHQFRKKTGKEWLPEDLFELRVVAEQNPADFKRALTAIKWFENKTHELEQKISAVKPS